MPEPRGDHRPAALGTLASHLACDPAGCAFLARHVLLRFDWESMESNAPNWIPRSSASRRSCALQIRCRNPALSPFETGEVTAARAPSTRLQNR